MADLVGLREGSTISFGDWMPIALSTIEGSYSTGLLMNPQAPGKVIASSDAMVKTNAFSLFLPAAVLKKKLAARQSAFWKSSVIVRAIADFPALAGPKSHSTFDLR